MTHEMARKQRYFTLASVAAWAQINGRTKPKNQPALHHDHGQHF
jgi:hypothetical protein